MPLIDCPDCGGQGAIWNPMDGRPTVCLTCRSAGKVPDDFFPEDSEELTRGRVEQPEVDRPREQKATGRGDRNGRDH